MGVGTATSATLNSVSGLVSYSMNIANAVTTSAQVVAKPTLTALDRIPSTFYSGQVQTVGLNGGGVSGAQVTNVPTGTSLSVTPTFIDEDTMMLAVKVSRSFIDSTSAVGGFNAGISTQNHNVTANVKIRFGETLILDGLTDREYDKSRNGVPVLQDIPIIQYLFSNVTKSIYSENVIVLITPRRVVSSEADLKKLESDMMKKTGRLDLQELSIYSQISLYSKLLSGRSNADTSLMALNRDSTFFREIKNEVLVSNDWIAESETSKFLNSAANTLYYR
jgi:type II secretory pathway component GspD/PulD (secretin)